ncbi:MAG: hypothetical protein ACYSUI_07655 [Planctomycetota bacterium]|jgi:hypothetical protein
MVESQRPVVVEQTAKRWKLLQGLGVLGLVCGCVPLFLGFGLESSVMRVFGGIAMATGLTSYIVGRSMAWWHHG